MFVRKRYDVKKEGERKWNMLPLEATDSIGVVALGYHRQTWILRFFNESFKIGLVNKSKITLPLVS